MTSFLALPTGANMMVSGQTQSGKSVFTSKLLMNCDTMFIDKPTCIFYYYRHWQALYHQLEQELGNRIRFKSTLPTEQELLNELDVLREEHKGQKHHFIICADDWMDQIYKNKLFLDLVTRIAHHENVSNIFLMQEGTIAGPHKKDLLNNIHANVYMASCRDRASLRQLAILLNDYACIMEAYDYVCKGGRGSYLMIMTHPASNPDFKYSTKIFPSDKDGPIIFKSQKHNK